MDHSGSLGPAHIAPVAPPACSACEHGAANLRNHYTRTLIPHYTAATTWHSTAAPPVEKERCGLGGSDLNSTPVNFARASSQSIGRSADYALSLLACSQASQQIGTDRSLAVSVANKHLLAWIAAQLRSGPERLIAVFAGHQRQFLTAEVLGDGAWDAIRCSWRHLFARALAHNSRAVLLAHNHPSGNPRPSAADLIATRQIGRMAYLLGIHLIDHLIIAGDDVHSICSARQL